LLILISRQGLSRPGKKPSMALIEPVQFRRATSDSPETNACHMNLILNNNENFQLHKHT
jgi:hypothetical protein